MALPLTWHDDLQMTVTVGGVGTLTLGVAVAGWNAFTAADDGKEFSFGIADGTAKETNRGVWNNSAKTLTRTQFGESTTGSALNVTTAATVFVDLTSATAASLSNEIQTYIRGLIVTKHASANTLDISAGACYDPAVGQVVSFAAVSGLSAGSLGASQWNMVYVDTVGATFEVVNNADPPSTPYAGTARQGGTNGNRRFIGWFRTSAASNILDTQVVEDGFNLLLSSNLNFNSSDGTNRVASAVTDVAYSGTPIALGGICPRYITTEVFLTATALYNTTAAALLGIELSLDGSKRVYWTNLYCPSVGGGGAYANTFWCAIIASPAGIHYKLVVAGAGVTPQLYLDGGKYKATR